MRSFIVGTAGHIDHGKSALVRALTGTDPDRLKEEKRRGITIDLGFAHCPLAADVVASFVDVPGHERFVRNMLAGAHGIDAVMLVVAADESVMPQTREHFHICRLLGIPRGLVVLTKCDAADAESQAVAEMEVRDLVASSFLDGRPVVRVSSRTGAGLDDLRQALLGLARDAPPRSASGLLRLPVDRIFTLKGFGTVVTGTLVGGSLNVEEEVVLLPRGTKARVRGLEVHGESVPLAVAGTRTAVNLAGILVSDVERGDVLVREGTLYASTRLDVEMTLLPSARGLDDGDRVRVHAGSAEVLARVRLLGARTLAPGEKGLAQLRLEGPAAAVPGDRLVLRSYSPAETVGGARVLDPQPPRRRRGDEALVRCLADAPNVSSLATLMVHEAGREGVATPSLAARLGVPLGDLDLILNEAEDIVRVGAPVVLVDRGALTLLARNAEATLARFHAKEPLKAGMPREELRERCFARVPDSLFARVLTDLEAQGVLRMTPTTVALASHEVRLTAGEAAVREALLVEVAAAGLQGVEAGKVGRPNAGSDALIQRVVRVVVAEGSIVRIGGDLLVSRDALARLVETVRRRFPPGSLLDVGAFKEATGLSRKYAIPLLEFLDRERVTRRAGDSRLVLSP